MNFKEKILVNFIDKKIKRFPKDLGVSVYQILNLFNGWNGYAWVAPDVKTEHFSKIIRTLTGSKEKIFFSITVFNKTFTYRSFNFSSFYLKTLLKFFSTKELQDLQSKLAPQIKEVNITHLTIGEEASLLGDKYKEISQKEYESGSLRSK